MENGLLTCQSECGEDSEAVGDIDRAEQQRLQQAVRGDVNGVVGVGNEEQHTAPQTEETSLG